MMKRALAVLLLLGSCGGDAEQQSPPAKTPDQKPESTYEQAMEKTRIQKARMELKLISDAVQLYRVKRGSPPESLYDLEDEQAVGRIPFTDPWDNDYVLEVEEARVRILSMGPDGEAGTEDDLVVQR